MLIAFNKPYGVVSQFTRESRSLRTLSEFGFPPGVYPIGRLDADTEGLLLLSDEAALNARLLHPARGHHRVYWAQVEGKAEAAALEKLARGIVLQGRPTLPCRAWLIQPPGLPPREPPIRFRKNVPESWMALDLIEGKNRQVRRMTAAIGHPTLRLWRAQIGGYHLENLPPGSWKKLEGAERRVLLTGTV